MKIGIVGAGIAGLALANLLDHAKYEIQLIDSAESLEPIGAGFTLQPNGLEVLRRIFQDDNPFREAALVSTSTIYDSQGEQLPIDIMGELSATNKSYSIHRGDIHSALLRNLDRKIGLYTSRRVERLDDGSTVGNMRVQYENGQIEKFDLIVGADGIKSVVRRFVEPSGSLTYGNGIAVRTIVPRTENDQKYQNFQAWMGRGKVVLAYPVKSGTKLNLAFYLTGGNTASSSWSQPVDLKWLAKEFHGWDTRLQDLIARSTDAFSWKLADLKPLSTWHREGSVLIGDAAHAMLPYLGQGANQSLVDAIELSKALNQANDHVSAINSLKSYETGRKLSAEKMQQFSRCAGDLFKQEFDGDRDLKVARVNQLLTELRSN